MSELFEGWIISIKCKADPDDTRALITIATEDLGDIRMGERIIAHRPNDD